MKNNSLDKINLNLKDRKNCFYWQTDRNISVQKAGEIWKDKHKNFKDEDLIKSVNLVLKKDKLKSLKKLDLNSQINLGNVNSVRVGNLVSEKEVIIRNHPIGVENGYFYVESLASLIAKENGIPSYKTFAISQIKDSIKHCFQVIEKLEGESVKFFLEKNPLKEEKIVFEIGKTMANLHKIKVTGFGPFDNDLAKKGILKGIHKTQKEALFASLDFNLKVLENENILTNLQVKKIKEIFDNVDFLDDVQPVLVHNDFADWNLLTNGEKITAVLDFDECVGADPILDIACWSTFFLPNRLTFFLKGYFSNTKKPFDFEKKFEIFRLRFLISKMTLRIRRYNWEKSDFLKSMIEKGNIHLKESLKYFKI